jgi:hypothetical protein
MAIEIRTMWNWKLYICLHTFRRSVLTEYCRTWFLRARSVGRKTCTDTWYSAGNSADIEARKIFRQIFRDFRWWKQWRCSICRCESRTNTWYPDPTDDCRLRSRSRLNRTDIKDIFGTIYRRFIRETVNTNQVYTSGNVYRGFNSKSRLVVA